MAKKNKKSLFKYLKNKGNSKHKILNPLINDEAYEIYGNIKIAKPLTCF
jgi:hypothetical protein